MTEVCIFLCDESGIMAEPWAKAGYACYCVDLKHKVRGDRVKCLGEGKIIFTYGDARYWTPPAGSRVVFLAGFPVCTDMAGSGAQDYSGLNGRIPKKGIPQLCDGLLLFNACYFAGAWSGAPFMIENPSGVIPTHFRRHDYTFQPWHYLGDEYQKLTCIWAGNGFVMPPREVFEKPASVTQKIWEMSPGENRAKERSKTPAGFARAVFEANCQKIKAIAI